MKYQRVQARIEAIEAAVSARYPTNDRLAEAYLKWDDESEVWIYRTLCKQRSSLQQVIATETAMASLYNN